MPAAFPHESFWVVLGTGAPVVGLAYVVAAGAALDARAALEVQALQMAKRRTAWAVPRAFVSSPAGWLLLISAAVIAGNAWVLAAALDSLTHERDAHSIGLASFLLVISLAMVGLQALLASSTARWAERTLGDYDKSRESELAEAFARGRDEADRRVADLRAEIATTRAETATIRAEIAARKRQWRAESLPEPDLYEDHYENLIQPPGEEPS